MGRGRRQRRPPKQGGTGTTPSAGRPAALSSAINTSTTATSTTAGDVVRLAWQETKASARLFGLLLMIFGVVFISSGPFYIAQRQAASHWLERLLALPSASGQIAGTPAIVEGRIAADPPAMLRHFVAYVYETQRGTKGSSSWWTEEAAGKSAFAIETPTTRVSLNANSYRYSPNVEPWLTAGAAFIDPIVRDWDHIDRRDGEAPGGAADHGRYRGLAIGEPVLAIGRTGEGNTFDADYVMAGSRQQFAAHLSHMAHGDHDTAAYWFTVIGATGLLLTLAGWLALVSVSVRAHWRPRQAAPR